MSTFKLSLASFRPQQSYGKPLHKAFITSVVTIVYELKHIKKIKEYSKRNVEYKPVITSS